MSVEVVRASEMEQEVLAEALAEYSIATGLQYDHRAIEEFILSTMADEQLVYFLAYAEDHGIADIGGFAVASLKLSSTALSISLIVQVLYNSPNIISPGIPQSLLEQAEEFGREQGAAKIVCYVPPHQHEYADFLQEMGYRRDPLCYYALAVSKHGARSNPNVQIASSKDATQLAELFNAYRMFFNQPSDMNQARAFIRARFSLRDAIIFVYHDPHSLELAGFAQVYQSYDATYLESIWIVNDLYVSEEHRRQGIAEALMRAIQQRALHEGVSRIELKIDRNNEAAQALYHKLGYVEIEAVREVLFKKL